MCLWERSCVSAIFQRLMQNEAASCSLSHCTVTTLQRRFAYCTMHHAYCRLINLQPPVYGLEHYSFFPCGIAFCCRCWRKLWLVVDPTQNALWFLFPFMLQRANRLVGKLLFTCWQPLLLNLCLALQKWPFICTLSHNWCHILLQSMYKSGKRDRLICIWYHSPPVFPGRG